MTARIYWQLDSAALPTRAEPALRPTWAPHLHDARTVQGNRAHYYGQLARATAIAGFDGLFFAYRPEADDSRITAAAVARLVPGLKLIAEFPAGIGSAVYAAKEAVSFQRSTRGALGWAIAHGLSAEDRAADGDLLPEHQLAPRLEEFLTVARGVHGATGFSFSGEYFEVANGGFAPPLNREPFPDVFLQGEDAADIAFSARLADVHLFADRDEGALAAGIAALRAEAARHDRSVSAGQRLAVVARETAEEVAEARDAGATGLVGTYDDVAKALAARIALGLDHLVLAAEPALEEAYRIGQFVLPRLRARLGDLQPAA